MSSRPGPTSAGENHIHRTVEVIDRRVEILEELLRLILPVGHEGVDLLLKQQDALRNEAEEIRQLFRPLYYCELCKKPFSDDKGLRRHIVRTKDELHQAQRAEVTKLICDYCQRAFPKRESVTRHMHKCPHRPVSAGSVRQSIDNDDDNDDDVGAPKDSHPTLPSMKIFTPAAEHVSYHPD